MLRRPPSLSYLSSRVRNATRVGTGDVREALAAALAVPESSLTATFHNVEHHQAHVASAFFVSPFEEAAILSVDGFGDFASTMLAHGRGNQFRGARPRPLPALARHLLHRGHAVARLPHYGDEGKVMGLAPYGDPERFLPQMREIVRTDGDVFELDLEYFTHHREGVEMTWDEGSPTIGRIFSERMVEAFGPAREPRAELTERHNDVAAALQARLEEVYLHLVDLARAPDGQREPLPGRAASP